MHRAVLLTIVDESFHIHAVLVVQASTHFGDADDLVSRFVHKLRGVRADITEALHDHSRALAGHAKLL